MGKGVQQLGDQLKQRLGNKVDVKVFPSAQLYSAAEEIEALQRGEVQMAFVIGGSVETISQSLQLVKLPFLFPNEDIAYKVLEGKTGKQLFKPLNDRGLEVVSIVTSGTVAISNNKRPITSPNDLKGLKMRSPGKMDTTTFSKLGANAIVTPSEETYSALQQGVIDGATTPSSVFMQRKFYEVQKHVTDGGALSFTVGYLLANKAFLDNLSPDVKKTVLETIKEVQTNMRKEIVQENQSVFKQIAEKGTTVSTLTLEQIAAFKTATAPVYDEMKSAIGADLIKSAQDEVQELSKK